VVTPDAERVVQPRGGGGYWRSGCCGCFDNLIYQNSHTGVVVVGHQKRKGMKVWRFHWSGNEEGNTAVRTAPKVRPSRTPKNRVFVEMKSAAMGVGGGGEVAKGRTEE